MAHNRIGLEVGDRVRVIRAKHNSTISRGAVGTVLEYSNNITVKVRIDTQSHYVTWYEDRFTKIDSLIDTILKEMYETRPSISLKTEINRRANATREV